MLGNLLTSLGIGAALILLGNGLLYRGLRLGAVQASAITAAATLGIYLPLAIVYWPGADNLAIHLAIYLVIPIAFAMILGAQERRSAVPDRRRLQVGPLAIIAFFVVLVVVDAMFVMLAEQGPSGWLARLLLPPSQGQGQVSSVFPGVISHDFQKKEALYNAYLEQVERQRQRGWQVRKGWLGKALAGQPAIFQVEVRDRQGQPVAHAEVAGRFQRPSDSRLDQDFTMHEVAPGLYRAELTLPAPGMWDLVLQVRRGEDLHEVRASTALGKEG
ncbi:MAG TPA: FixH family protein [Candidatus Competibacteraceae bacterium]|nr:FixH family protein [Candidatus Competibacteraceae bacterium]